MDAAQNMVTSMRLNALKEPRGFIRILQVILAIFAFATTCSVSTSVKFKVTCKVNTTTEHSVNVPFSYPFSLDEIHFNVPTCNNGEMQDMAFEAGATAPSQFFVAVGVLAFLYSLAAIILYIFFDDLYRKENKIIIGDFVVTAIFALFWLISSSAWANGLSGVKYTTDPKTGIFPSAIACQNRTANCVVESLGDFSSLNVSIIFGFLNLLVWGGNIWFLYKETPWFKGDSSSNYNPDSTMPQGSMGGSPTQPSAT